ncbi:hypothetical protein [Bacillus velezensis]|uniref:hypothetical protein n=1 Tax=Bacillus velezensis TaxID=492670 RepID=UPI001436C4F7|nr:hypothetical protein [Bacillus velezensis]QIW82524.1 hypothetical protein HCC49_01160 [Bacillus velezensis]WFO87633.1 hypothetical protein JEQ16_01250 [Bacillus velezensis]
MKTRKFFATLCIVTPLVFGSFTSVKAVDSYNSETVNYILKMNPNLAKKELIESVNDLVKQDNKTSNEILEEIKTELKKQEKLDKEEDKSNRMSTMGKNSGPKIIGSSSKGNVYYTPASTFGLPHGHVGMYYKGNQIVESVPKKGVRAIASSKRKVEKNAVIQNVKVSSSKKNNSVNWGYSRVGKDGYSYNFATNRKSSHYGDKNCSKLLWSAFKLKAGIDMDKDKGLGVYPRDIRDSNYTKTIKTFR